MCDLVNLDYLKHHYDKLEGINKILEVGSYNVNGNCKDFFLQRGLNYLGIDIMQGPDVDLICDITDDIRNIYEKLGHDKFDLVICMNVLEHLYEPIKALNNIISLLRNGGYIIIVTPLVWDLHDWPHDYYRLNPDFYKKYTKDSNLRILDDTFLLSSRENRQFYPDLNVIPMIIPDFYKPIVQKSDFLKISSDIDELWSNLIQNSYINNEGGLQQAFTLLRDVSEFKINAKYNHIKPDIFQILQKTYFSLILTNLSMYIPELRECWPHIYLNLICQKV
jgi:SAM-dependent methyltransferase